MYAAVAEDDARVSGQSRGGRNRWGHELLAAVFCSIIPLAKPKSSTFTVRLAAA